MVQVLILRELFVVLSGNELCVGMALGSWLVGIALGAAVAAFVSDRINQRLFFSFSLASLPILAIGAVIVIRLLRAILEIPLGEQVPPSASLAASLVCAGSLGVVIGFAFPVAAAAYRQVPREGKRADMKTSDTVSVVYAFESVGSLSAGILLSFYLVGHFETLRILIWLGVMAGFMAHILASDYRSGWALLVWTAIVVAVSTCGGGRALESWSNHRRWTALASGELLRSLETPYQHLDLGNLSGQCNLYGNGGLLFSFPDPYREEIDAHFWMSLHPMPRSVLLIGGLGGRYLSSLLAHQPQLVDYVEMDAGVIEVTRGHDGQALAKALSSKNVRVHTTDGRRFVRQTREHYDVAIVALPEPSTALLNRFYTKEFYEEVRRVLAPEGILITQVEAPGTYLAGEVGAYAASVYWTLRDVFPNVSILADGTITFVGCEAVPPPVDQPDLIVERLRSRGISSGTFVPESILTRLLPLRAKTVRESLDTLESVGRNSDVSPQSYLRRLILWCRETGSGSLAVSLGWMDSRRHFLLLVLLLLVSVPWIFLGLGPRQASLIACVAAIGCAGMGLELVAIYMYQNLYGYLYQEIGFLIAVFMAGLAVGAPVGRRLVRRSRPSRVLIGLVVSAALFTLLFPLILWTVAEAELERNVGVAVYGGLILVTGILVGSVFPVAVAVLAGEEDRAIGRPVGFIDAADHLGGALGAFLPGVVLFPLFGIIWTCLLLATGLACVALGFLFATYVRLS
jgi:spermidine synthase